MKKLILTAFVLLFATSAYCQSRPVEYILNDVFDSTNGALKAKISGSATSLSVDTTLKISGDAILQGNGEQIYLSRTTTLPMVRLSANSLMDSAGGNGMIYVDAVQTTSPIMYLYNNAAQTSQLLSILQDNGSATGHATLPAATGTLSVRNDGTDNTVYILPTQAPAAGRYALTVGQNTNATNGPYGTSRFAGVASFDTTIRFGNSTKNVGVAGIVGRIPILSADGTTAYIRVYPD